MMCNKSVFPGQLSRREMDMDTRNSSNLYRKRLTSLTTHLRKYERPPSKRYDEYATSYISGDIPWKKILPEEIEPADLPPFSPKFEVEHFTLQENERKLRGESVRNQDLIPSSQIIYDHIKETEGLPDRNKHLDYLYFKAMQYSEVNKALALNEKYPKHQENRIRVTFSKEHQAAVAQMLKKCKKTGKVTSESLRLQQMERPLLELPTVKCSSEEDRRMARTDTELEELSQIRRMIKEALGMPPLMKSSAKILEEPWQFQVKADRPRAQPPKRKKLKWKRNIYPPKTREEKIAELRAKAPPMLPEHLETDQLPGLWRPELMIDSFQTLYMEVKEKEATGAHVESRDSWLKLFDNNKKCIDWLKSIPDTL